MVVISNGFRNFHLVMAGAEANARNILTIYIAGAYPTKAIAGKLSNPLIKRFIDFPRFMARKESIDDELVRSKWLPELLQSLALKILNFKHLKKLSEYLVIASLKWYSNQAIKDVWEAHKKGAKIYHYRAGFGHRSAKVARELGMITLCDHSIVHPATLQYMIHHKGELPDLKDEVELNNFWRHVLEDFQYADEILVNSEFVKKTFLSQGWDANLIHVAYLGIDTPFLKHVKSIEKDINNSELRLIFAGHFGDRKGADILIESLLELDHISWYLDIAGVISPYVKQKYGEFLNDKRVNVLGVLSRAELADHMQAADVFVFPSLAEGSARVIFEAMACGCYVITTPNSGSIVESNTHGELVSPSDAVGLRKAIIKAASDREMIHEVGIKNTKLIRENYLQCVYGDQLKNIYDALIRKYYD